MNYEPVTAGNQTNKNASIKDNTQQYILLPLLYDSLKSLEDAVADDAGKRLMKNQQIRVKEKGSRKRKTVEASNIGSDDQNVQDFRAALDNLLVQQKEGYANNTNRDSTVSAARQSFTNADDLLTDPLMPNLEDTADLLNTGIFSGAYDDEDVGAEADLNNLGTTMNILVDLPKGKHSIETKWVYRNKIDERWIVVRKTRPNYSHKGYTLKRWKAFDYDEVFAPVARIEAIRLFLDYAPFMGFIVYQMDVKSAFLYGTIEEEVYVCQPPSFEDPRFPDKVYKVEKALYGLHQAPRAWYETLPTYLLKNRFRRGTIDKTLFIKKDKCDILLVQVYVDDIIFGSTKKSLCVEFEQMMHKRFQMSSIGELTFFLGGSLRYLKGKPKWAALVPKDSPFNWKLLSDYLIMLELALTATIVANSTTKAEYVAAANCCGQSRMDGRTCNIKQKCVKSQIPKRGRDTKIPQSGGPPEKVGDEAVYKELEFLKALIPLEGPDKLNGSLQPIKDDSQDIVEIVLWYLDSSVSNTRWDNMTNSSISSPSSSVLSDSAMIILQFCDLDLEVAFRKHTCFIRNLEGVDLLSGSHSFNLYKISLNDMMKSSPIYNGTKFINQTLRSYTEDVGITHQTSVTRTPQQNGVVERRNRTLVEAARDLRKLKPKAYIGIFIGYSASKKAYRLYNKRTRMIMEIIHVQFDELTHMASKQHSLGPELQSLTSGQISLGLVPNNAPSTSNNLPSKKDLDILFQPMFNEYFKPSQSVVSLTISAATLPQDTVGATSSISIDQDVPSPSTTPNIETFSTQIQDANVEEPNQENAKFDSDTFTNPFTPPQTSSAKSSSSRIINSLNIHTFQQPHSYIKRWTKDHLLVTIISNPSKPVSIRRQFATDAMWCYFHAFLTKVELKNYKEAMKESSWIEAMQEKIHEFE
ncbi:putative ribonuclease H-like domain-containing protein [Tanacetum coccineum]